MHSLKKFITYLCLIWLLKKSPSKVLDDMDENFVSKSLWKQSSRYSHYANFSFVIYSRCMRCVVGFFIHLVQSRWVGGFRNQGCDSIRRSCLIIYEVLLMEKVDAVKLFISALIVEIIHDTTTLPWPGSNQYISAKLRCLKPLKYNFVIIFLSLWKLPMWWDKIWCWNVPLVPFFYVLVD